MIYITADTHGEIERFSSKNTKKLKALDTLFVAGDFGFVWRSKNREKNLKKLAKLPYKIFLLMATTRTLRPYPLTRTRFTGVPRQKK